MDYFFAADTHFFHKNICKYTHRPFSSVEEMNETLINNWNSVVSDGDEVFFLGDFSFGNASQVKDILFRLKGQIKIVYGNHDSSLKQFLKGINNYPELKKRIQILGDYAEIKINGQEITLCHYAMKVWKNSSRLSYSLFGHSHGNLPDDPHSLSMDVGVDCCNYFPISFEQVKEFMLKKTFIPIDHHI
jgi:calcineurin-like phosphoesterase family protein